MEYMINWLKLLSPITDDRYPMPNKVIWGKVFTSVKYYSFNHEGLIIKYNQIKNFYFKESRKRFILLENVNVEKSSNSQLNDKWYV